MVNLLGKTIDELQTIAQSVGLQRFAGKQIAEWLYQKRVKSIDEMTNISLRGREALSQAYTIKRHEPITHITSEDGTKKYLFKIGDHPIETVYIPDEERATLCVSTQMGCQMGCKFCMTGALGFMGQLEAGEILNQIFSIPEGDQITNIVYMGEGEPMQNIDEVMKSLQVMTSNWGCAWSPKRITVSSVGLISGLKRFLDESECHLAISLHNPFPSERREIMPAERKDSITDVLALIKQYDWQHQRRISFEYICWGGINDSPKYANELLRLLRHLNCRVNLIRFHAGVDNQFPASQEKQMEWMRDYMNEKGLTTTIRRSRGEDILAACGMLANQLEK